MRKSFRLFGIKLFETEQRSVETPTGTLSTPSAELLAALGGHKSDAGVPVTQSTVLTLTAVWRAVNLLSGTIAAMPLQVFERKANGSRVHVAGHPAERILRNPSPLISSFSFKETVQATLTLWGNGYAVIRRDPMGKVLELIPVHPSNVHCFEDENQMYYNVRTKEGLVTIPSRNMLHIPGLSFDGRVGHSVISVMRESMGLGLAAQKFGSKFFGSGANMSGVLESPGVLSDKAYNNLRSSWDNTYAGIDNSHKTSILEEGVQYKRIGIPPNDAQFLETRQFQVSEVARMFGVPPHLLFDLDRSTNNNIEHQGIEFITYSLLQWLSRWEAELDRKLIPAEQRETYYHEFNVAGLLRGDQKSRGEFYKLLFNIGSISPNEIRAKENMPAYEGGDRNFVQAGYMPTTIIEQYHLSKSKKDVKEKTE